MLIKCLILLLLTAICAVPSVAEDELRLIDLARLSITKVSASSVNGDREQSNGYYGVLNLFDNGSNIINNINYTTWLSDAEPIHWVKLKFGVPVTLCSVLVETTNHYAPKALAVEVTLSKVRDSIARAFDSVPVSSFRTIFTFPAPQQAVQEVKIVFPGPEMVEASEIRVYGTPPNGVDLTPVRPNIFSRGKKSPRRHTSEIKRKAGSVEEERMILKAEAVYPRAAEVLKAAAESKSRFAPSKKQEKLLWYDDLGGVHIPFAITGDAVDFYAKLVDGYRNNIWDSDFEPSSHFSYTAICRFQEVFTKDERTFRGVYVVEMKMSFGATFGNLSGVDFEKTRNVVLDSSGKCLALFGDGTTSYLVAAAPGSPPRTNCS